MPPYGLHGVLYINPVSCLTHAGKHRATVFPGLAPTPWLVRRFAGYVVLFLIVSFAVNPPRSRPIWHLCDRILQPCDPDSNITTRCSARARRSTVKRTRSNNGARRSARARCGTVYRRGHIRLWLDSRMQTSANEHNGLAFPPALRCYAVVSIYRVFYLVRHIQGSVMHLSRRHVFIGVPCIYRG